MLTKFRFVMAFFFVLTVTFGLVNQATYAAAPTHDATPREFEGDVTGDAAWADELLAVGLNQTQVDLILKANADILQADAKGVAAAEVATRLSQLEKDVAKAGTPGGPSISALVLTADSFAYCRNGATATYSAGIGPHAGTFAKSVFPYLHVRTGWNWSRQNETHTDGTRATFYYHIAAGNGIRNHSMWCR